MEKNLRCLREKSPKAAAQVSQKEGSLQKAKAPQDTKEGALFSARERLLEVPAMLLFCKYLIFNCMVF